MKTLIIALCALLAAGMVVVGVNGLIDSFTKDVYVHCVVKTHVGGCDRYGHISYATVTTCEDGFTRVSSDVDDYIKPVGADIIFTEHIFTLEKWHK